MTDPLYPCRVSDARDRVAACEAQVLLAQERLTEAKQRLADLIQLAVLSVPHDGTGAVES